MVINFRIFMTALRIYCEFRLCSCLFSLMMKQNSLFNKTQEKNNSCKFTLHKINQSLIHPKDFLLGFSLFTDTILIQIDFKGVISKQLS